jgi:hypothetical protein
MGCTRGRSSPSAQTERELWASCGGFCQRPTCRGTLFVEVSKNGRVAIGEMAHIFCAADSGPRVPPNQMSDREKAAFENLIVLCPNCHTLIDKDESSFPDSLLQKWKADHIKTIHDALMVPRFQSRHDARVWVEERLLANRVVHSEFGPDRDYRFDPESEMASVWRRKVIEHVIPRNRQILAALDVNASLLTPHEKLARELFRQHVDDQEAFHIWADVTVRARFPVEVKDVFCD